jgi:uncharacterized membrane protein YfcA
MPADPGLMLLATAAPPLLPPAEIMALVLTGLGAGMLGGLLGIGGSIIMIPVLTLGFSHDQHLSQAAAMIINVAVAVASYSQHRRAGAIPQGTVPRLVPAAVAAIMLGVVASNHFDGTGLQRIFGGFLVLVVAMNVQRLVHQRAGGGGDRKGSFDEPPAGPPRTIPALLVAGIVGGSAGLLGIGGGIIAVPLCQRVLGMPIRASIATSATLMCLTAPVGAVVKNLSLPDGQSAADAAIIAGVLAPTAIIGSLLGARLTHVLPTLWLRAALVFLLSWAAVKFLGLA